MSTILKFEIDDQIRVGTSLFKTKRRENGPKMMKMKFMLLLIHMVVKITQQQILQLKVQVKVPRQVSNTKIQETVQ